MNRILKKTHTPSDPTIKSYNENSSLLLEYPDEIKKIITNSEEASGHIFKVPVNVELSYLMFRNLTISESSSLEGLIHFLIICIIKENP